MHILEKKNTFLKSKADLYWVQLQIYVIIEEQCKMFGWTRHCVVFSVLTLLLVKWRL